MPMYRWVDKNTGKEIEVVRTLADFDLRPTDEEVGPLLNTLEFNTADWERVIGTPSLVRGPSWRGAKGYW